MTPSLARRLAALTLTTTLLTAANASAGSPSAAAPSKGEATRASVSTAGAGGNGESLGRDLSADGRFVTFESAADDLVIGDANGADDVFVRDRQRSTTELLSAAWTGGSGNGASHGASVSADGRAVAFYSFATDLVGPPAVPALTSAAQVYVREAGTTSLVSIGCTVPDVPCAHSQDPAISGDGRYVAFRSFGSSSQVYVHDRRTRSTRLASVTPDGSAGNGGSSGVDVSGDGRTVVFNSMATDLVDESEPGGGVFAFDASTGTVSRVSHVHRWGAGTTSVSADGRSVAFTSFLPELDDDTNGWSDAYLRDRVTGTLVRVSDEDADARTDDVTLSPDGRFVAFTSAATNLAKDAKDAVPDLFLRDLARPTSRPTLVSVLPDGSEAGVDYWGGGAALSSGATSVAFTSSAALVAGDDNDVSDVFVRDLR